MAIERRMLRTALIFGVTGQDGAYLTRFLLTKNYRVVGTSRGLVTSPISNLDRLEVRDNLQLKFIDTCDDDAVSSLLQETKPDEVYNFAGQSSVGLSFKHPRETIQSIFQTALNILEGVRQLKKECRVFNSCSAECFGELSGSIATEETSFNPLSPYAVAKESSYWLFKNYRESFGLYSCSGILFNHESPLRQDQFVSKKIIRGALDIAEGKQDKLCLGNIDISRDWGWAPEYVEGMWLALQQENADEYIFATGKTCSLRDFVRLAFSELGLNYEEHVIVNASLKRPQEIVANYANPKKSYEKLGWRAQLELPDIIKKLIIAEKSNRQLEVNV